MKKRTKISLRTRIYLTIAGLLTLAGVLYAANPTIFVSPGHGLHDPIGVVIGPRDNPVFYASQYENGNIINVDCGGTQRNGTFFGNAFPSTELVEKYMAMA